jgi:hypothetical protein
MTNQTAPPQRLVAVHLDNGQETLLGTVALAANGMMTVEESQASPQDGTETKLARLAREVNATDVMHVDVPPREDAPEFTLASAVIPRGDPRFIPALKDYIHTYYGIELREP